jgi:general secretion pathway protein C
MPSLTPGRGGGVNHNRAMPARLSAFVVWALVAAGVMFWGLRLGVKPGPAPANAQAVSVDAGLRGDFTRLLGAAPTAASVAPPPPAASNRFRLLGVLAPPPVSGSAMPSKAGVALIAVDGKMARAYAIGAPLDGDWVLQSISRRSATVGPAQGGTGVVLDLPPPTPAATGALPRAVEGEPARAMVPAPVVAPAPAMAQPPQVPPIAVPQAGMQPQFMPSNSPAQQSAEATDDESQPAVSSRRRGGSSAR